MQVRLIRDVLAEAFLASAVEMNRRRHTPELRRHGKLAPLELHALDLESEPQQGVQHLASRSSARNEPPPRKRSARSPTRSRSSRSDDASQNGPSSSAIKSSAVRRPDRELRERVGERAERFLGGGSFLAELREARC